MMEDDTDVVVADVSERNVGVVDIQQHRRMRVELRGCSLALANGLRRALMSDVPTLAIDSVRIARNDSVVADSELAHRLGLVPLHDPGPSPFGAPGDGEGLPTFALRSDEGATPPSGVRATLRVDAVRERRVVRAGDIAFDPPRVVPARADAVVAILAPGQGLDVECVVAWGVGRWHAKWSAAVAVACMRARPRPMPPCGVCGRRECGDPLRSCSQDSGSDHQHDDESATREHALEFSTTGAVTPPHALLCALSALRGRLRAFVRAVESGDGRMRAADPSDPMI